MDKLDVIKRAEELGGKERRKALIDLMVHARRLGCETSVGGGRGGGINVRFGSIGYAIMDVKTNGAVKVYVDPHPGRRAPNELWIGLNDCLESNPDMKPKTFPVRSHGELQDKIEEIPADQLQEFVTEAVSGIWQTYYEPHIA